MKNKNLREFLWKANKKEVGPQFNTWYIKISGSTNYNIVRS